MFRAIRRRRFPARSDRQIGGELLYLAPDPDEPFRRLTLAIWKLLPDHPPYDGKHPEIAPHLTVASITDAARSPGVCHH
ncbi:MAG TPA: 2'-5' RNA ligase family protein, partial [Dongiaceae bacterium]